MTWTLYAKMADSDLSKRRKLQREMKKRKNKPSTIKKYICGTVPQWKKIMIKWRNRPNIKGYWYTVMHYLHRNGSVKSKPIILSPRETKGKRPPLILKRKNSSGKVVGEKRYPVCKPMMLEKYKRRQNQKLDEKKKKKMRKQKKQDKIRNKKSFLDFVAAAERQYTCATPLTWKTRNGKGAWSCMLKFKRENGSIGTEPFIQSRDYQVKPRRVTVRGLSVPYCQGAECGCKGGLQ